MMTLEVSSKVFPYLEVAMRLFLILHRDTRASRMKDVYCTASVVGKMHTLQMNRLTLAAPARIPS